MDGIVANTSVKQGVIKNRSWGMTLAVMAILAVAVGCGVVYFRSARPTSPSASTSVLEITPKQQHLGKIRQYQAKDFSFKVTNTSKETLEITDVTKSCGCTEAKVKDTILKSGQSTELTGRLAAQDRLGEFGSVIHLATKIQSEESTVDVKVGAHAVTLLHGPSHLDLGEYFLGSETAVKKFTFEAGEDDMSWDVIRVRAEGLDAQLSREGSLWQLKIQPPIEKEVGLFYSDLMLEFWEKGKSTPVAGLPLKASWKIKSKNIQISPLSAYFGVLRSGEEKTVRLKVKSLTGKPLQLGRAELPKGFSGNVRLVTDQNQLYLEIRTRGMPLGGGGMSGMLRLIISNENASEIFRIGLIGKT